MPGRTASSIRRMAAEPWVAANSKHAIWSMSLTRRSPDPGRTNSAEAFTGSQPSARTTLTR